MDALLNEYRYWRDNKIQKAFEEPVANAEALKEYVEYECMDFHYQYSESITLRQYKNVQYELLQEGVEPELIIGEPLAIWCQYSINEDDWNVLFEENEPETETESETESEEELEPQE
jgi:hypothetical protein